MASRSAWNSKGQHTEVRELVGKCGDDEEDVVKSLFNEASPSTTVTGRCLPSGFLRNFPSFKFDRDQVDQRWPRPPSTKKLCRRAQGRVSLRGAPPWRLTRTQNPPRMVSASLPCGTNRKPSDQGPKHQQEGGNWIQATIIFRSPSDPPF